LRKLGREALPGRLSGARRQLVLTMARKPGSCFVIAQTAGVIDAQSPGDRVSMVGMPG
jgi:hypothetical protein